MDKSWMSKSRLSKDYEDGLIGFLDFAFANSSCENMIVCPCKECRLITPVTRDVAFEHLKCDEFMNGYNKWVFHGETFAVDGQTRETVQHVSSDADIDMFGLLNDAFGAQDFHNNVNPENVNEQENRPFLLNAENFFNLVNDAEKELYPGCKNFSKLKFLIRAFHLKCVGGMSDKVFSMWLQLIKEALPEGENLPKSFYEAEKLIKNLGLGCQKIHVCPNDCMLYWGEHKGDIECYLCKTPRYKVLESGKFSKIPQKMFRYFPLIPRLQRMFMSSEIASFMSWHHDGRTKDGNMRHPADSPAWHTFDHKNLDFSSEIRNIRLGLATDGTNPFRSMSSRHSTWPVVLIPNNLPPWMCMKQSNFILSMIIPSPIAPGNNIDVYLQPLIEELKILWGGVDTYDASRRENFKMKAALLWTISDFSGYAYLSGWSTKGKYACPHCNKDTCFKRLKHWPKYCYMGHRRFLDKNHPYRFDEKSFDGSKELGLAPTPLTGDMVIEMLSGFQIKYGKGSDNPKLPYNLKKRSIFFELPYWKDNLVPHNFDVMHTEKNTCESIVGTLLNVDGKTKDNLKSRNDLKWMNIRHELHPRRGPENKTVLPPACFSLKKEEKYIFCKFLKTVKVPDGYAANNSRCVDMKQRKLVGLKSHDYHIIMQQLLPLATRGLLSSHVCSPLIELSSFFRQLYSKVLRANDLVCLEKQIVVTICNLERIFPPSFFDIMIHLVIHLATETRLAGPVQYRSMYPIERYLCKLKSFVKSKSHPEGSIAENYILDECLTFCSRYMKGVETKLTSLSRNQEGKGLIVEGLAIFLNPGRPLGSRKTLILDDVTRDKAYRYVLFNCNEIEPYIKRHPRLNQMAKEKVHSEKFALWFEKQVDGMRNDETVRDNPNSIDIAHLARGPHQVYAKYKRYMVNGFRFHTKDIEEKRKTQNSGVVVIAKTSSFENGRDYDPILKDVAFYGIVRDIIELDYLFEKRVVLFKCDWIAENGVKKDKDSTLVNFSRLLGDNDPFVLASQVEQVMYVEDIKNKGWNVVIKLNPRDYYDMEAQMPTENVESYLQSVNLSSQHGDMDAQFNLIRTDAPSTTLNVPFSNDLESSCADEDDENGNEDEIDS